MTGDPVCSFCGRMLPCGIDHSSERLRLPYGVEKYGEGDKMPREEVIRDLARVALGYGCGPTTKQEHEDVVKSLVEFALGGKTFMESPECPAREVEGYVPPPIGGTCAKCGKHLRGDGSLIKTDGTNFFCMVCTGDAVDHPPHYNEGGIECIEALEASSTVEEFQGYLKNNTMKYLWRYRYKGKPVQDLEKAAWYLNRLIEFLKKQEAKKRLEGEHRP